MVLLKFTTKLLNTKAEHHWEEKYHTMGEANRRIKRLLKNNKEQAAIRHTNFDISEENAIHTFKKSTL